MDGYNIKTTLLGQLEILLISGLEAANHILLHPTIGMAMSLTQHLQGEGVPKGCLWLPKPHLTLLFTKFAESYSQDQPHKFGTGKNIRLKIENSTAFVTMGGHSKFIPGPHPSAGFSVVLWHTFNTIQTRPLAHNGPNK